MKTAADWPLTAQLPVDAASAAQRGLRPGASSGRSSPAATSCSTAASPRPSRSREGRRLPVRRRHGRHHRPLPAAPAFGWEVPQTQRTGRAGAMRDLLQGADLAIANFENPAPESFRYHTSGTVFSADPKLIKGLAERRASTGCRSRTTTSATPAATGILQTIANLADYGIKSGGAGKDAKTARRPTILDAGGTKVGIIAYDTIAPGYRAGTTKPGSASFTVDERQVGRPEGARRRRPGRDRLPALGHRVRPDAVRRPAERSPTPRSMPAPTSSSATTPTGRARSRSTRASRSGTRSATSSSTRPGRSRRWRA